MLIDLLQLFKLTVPKYLGKPQCWRLTGYQAMAIKQGKDLDTLKRKAKTFDDLVRIIARWHKREMLGLQSLLKSRKRFDIALRTKREEFIRQDASLLRSLEARRQRHEQVQANKQIPGVLRKKIAELETHILRLEPGYEAYQRSWIRSSKGELAELLVQVDRIINPPKPLATTNKAFTVGKDYSGQSITRSYDGHVWEVLRGHVERLSRAKGQRASFKIVAALPEKAEYLQLKERHFTHTLEKLVDDAYGIVDELQGELQAAYENMPEGLQGSPVGEARSEAADQLGNISDPPELPPCVSSLRIVHYPSLHQTGRRQRAYEAEEMMQAVAKAIRQYRESEAKLTKAEAKDLDECCRQLEGHAEELDSVEFPGMFGQT